jgi:molecular chaperone DnaK (HSP70)
MFYTMTKGQEELKVIVTQGEDTSPDFVNKIATHTLHLPPDRPADRPIKVTYSYDLNQRMHCKFVDVESNQVLDVDLNMGQNGKMSEVDENKRTEQLEAVKVE